MTFRVSPSRSSWRTRPSFGRDAFAPLAVSLRQPLARREIAFQSTKESSGLGNLVSRRFGGPFALGPSYTWPGSRPV
ncbi:hypothetical protein T261_00110 [Streptomyces lydicus]|nr:hypothetical protein T261_00110 [Streptomyces lydicus]